MFSQNKIDEKCRNEERFNNLHNYLKDIRKAKEDCDTYFVDENIREFFQGMDYLSKKQIEQFIEKHFGSSYEAGVLRASFRIDDKYRDIKDKGERLKCFWESSDKRHTYGTLEKNELQYVGNLAIHIYDEANRAKSGQYKVSIQQKNDYGTMGVAVEHGKNKPVPKSYASKKASESNHQRHTQTTRDTRNSLRDTQKKSSQLKSLPISRNAKRKNEHIFSKNMLIAMSIVAILIIGLFVWAILFGKGHVENNYTNITIPPRVEFIHPDQRTQDYNRGMEYYEQEEYEDAIACFEIALQNAPPIDLETAKIHVSLGLAQRMKALSSNSADSYRILEDALDSMVSAAAIFREEGDIGDTIYAIMNMALINNSLGDIDGESKNKAIEQYKEAYELSKSVYGVNDSYTCYICNCIVSAYIELNNSADANYWLDLALSVDITGNTQDTSSFGDILYDIGRNCWYLERFSEAGGMFEEAKKVYETLDVRSERLAGLYNELAAYYNSILGDSQSALRYDELALLIRQEVYGAESSEMALSYHNLANDYRDSYFQDTTQDIAVYIKNIEEAYRLYKHSFEVLSKMQQKDSYDQSLYECVNNDLVQCEWKLQYPELSRDLRIEGRLEFPLTTIVDLAGQTLYEVAYPIGLDDGRVVYAFPVVNEDGGIDFIATDGTPPSKVYII